MPQLSTTLTCASPLDKSRVWTTTYTKFVPFLQILKEHTSRIHLMRVGVVFVERGWGAMFTLKFIECCTFIRAFKIFTASYGIMITFRWDESGIGSGPDPQFFWVEVGFFSLLHSLPIHLQNKYWILYTHMISLLIIARLAAAGVFSRVVIIFLSRIIYSKTGSSHSHHQDSEFTTDIFCCAKFLQIHPVCTIQFVINPSRVPMAAASCWLCPEWPTNRNAWKLNKGNVAVVLTGTSDEAAQGITCTCEVDGHYTEAVDDLREDTRWVRSHFKGHTHTLVFVFCLL